MKTSLDNERISLTAVNNHPVRVLVTLRGKAGAPVRSTAEEDTRVRVAGGLPLPLTSVQRQQAPTGAAKGRRNHTLRRTNGEK